jgi:hypothetical protein
MSRARGFFSQLGQMVGFDSAAGDAAVMGSSTTPSVVFISGAVGDYSACVNGGYDRTSEMSNGYPVYIKRGDESMLIEKSRNSANGWDIKDLSDKGSDYSCAIIQGGLNARACIRIWNYSSFAAQSTAKMLTGQEAERAVSRLVFNDWHATQSPRHPIKPRMQQYCCVLVFCLIKAPPFISSARIICTLQRNHLLFTDYCSYGIFSC